MEVYGDSDVVDINLARNCMLVSTCRGSILLVVGDFVSLSRFGQSFFHDAK